MNLVTGNVFKMDQVLYDDNNLTLETLDSYWKSVKYDKESIVLFYSHKYGPYRIFSNFYEINHNFTIPNWCGLYGGTTVSVKFSEQSIMLCKASLFRDKKSFFKIKSSTNPHNCKLLGRNVSNFNDIVWKRHICNIAFETVYQKFNNSDTFKALLLSTNNSFIAEAAPNDIVWGIGMNENDVLIQHINLWRGSNLLGFSLMKVRNRLLLETIKR